MVSSTAKSVMRKPSPVGTAARMYLMLSLAVGDDGPWIGKPDGSTQKWRIDYVRVWDQKPRVAVPCPPELPWRVLLRGALVGIRLYRPRWPVRRLCGLHDSAPSHRPPIRPSR